MEQNPAQRRSILPISLIIAAGILITFLLIGCLVMLFLIAPVANIPMPHRYVYRVRGQGTQADITYTDRDGNQHSETVTLPWEYSMATFGNDFHLSISAVSTEGDIHCEIEMDRQILIHGNGLSDVYCEGVRTGTHMYANAGGDAPTPQPTSTP